MVSGGPRHAVLCLAPWGLTSNPLSGLLHEYDLTLAQDWSGAVRKARRSAFDLFVMHAPLGWAESTEICQRIRTFDAHTPIIVYSVQPSPEERRETLQTGCVQAYLGRWNDAHNVAATAAQLIMLAELRSMDAARTATPLIEETIARRFSGGRLLASSLASVPQQLALRVKIEACRIFARAGGTRANFERLWPSIYESVAARLRATTG